MQGACARCTAYPHQATAPTPNPCEHTQSGTIPSRQVWGSYVICHRSRTAVPGRPLPYVSALRLHDASLVSMAIGPKSAFEEASSTASSSIRAVRAARVKYPSPSPHATCPRFTTHSLFGQGERPRRHEAERLWTASAGQGIARHGCLGYQLSIDSEYHVSTRCFDKRPPIMSPITPSDLCPP